MKSKVLGLLAVGLLAGPMSAAAIDFQFSFTSTNSAFGTVPGSVSGRILGLVDNSTSSAVQVLIDSFPAALNSIAGPTPIDAMLWDQQKQNSFTVLNGQVIAGGFWAQQTIGGFAQGYQLYINGTTFGYNFLNLDGVDQAFVWGNDGLAAANVQPLAAVPEPGSLALLGLGIVGLGLSRRRKAA